MDCLGELRLKNVLRVFPQVCCCIPVNSVPLGGERSDQAHPNSADGDGPDEGAREGPRNAVGPSVQLGPLLRKHPRTETNMAGQHGPRSPEEWRSLRGADTVTRPQQCLILGLVLQSLKVECLQESAAH